MGAPLSRSAYVDSTPGPQASTEDPRKAAGAGQLGHQQCESPATAGQQGRIRRESGKHGLCVRTGAILSRYDTVDLRPPGRKLVDALVLGQWLRSLRVQAPEGHLGRGP